MTPIDIEGGYEEEDYESDLKKELLAKRELKPCPFCGSTEVEIDGRDEGYGVLCRNCGVWATSGRWWFDDSKDAIELWNRRVKE